MGLGYFADRRWQGRPDRVVGTNDAVCDRLRFVYGLRSVFALTNQGRIRPHWRQCFSSCRWPRSNGARDHSCRIDHGLRILGIRAWLRPQPQTVWSWSCSCCIHRRNNCANGLSASNDGTLG